MISEAFVSQGFTGLISLPFSDLPFSDLLFPFIVIITARGKEGAEGFILNNFLQEIATNHILFS